MNRLNSKNSAHLAHGPAGRGVDEGAMRLVFLGLSFRTSFTSLGCESRVEVKALADVLRDLLDYLVGLHQQGPLGGGMRRHVETGGPARGLCDVAQRPILDGRRPASRVR